MPMKKGSAGHLWLVLTCRIVGLLVFAWAFLLPAVRLGAAGDASAAVYPGFKCASLALSETMTLFGKTVQGTAPVQAYLLVASGWINPLIVIILLLSFWRILQLVRRILGVLVLLCMAATWVFLAMEKLTPLLGHFLWIAGALAVLAAELPRARPRPTVQAGPA
jgi:hypothetical protein